VESKVYFELSCFSVPSQLRYCQSFKTKTCPMKCDGCIIRRMRHTTTMASQNRGETRQQVRKRSQPSKAELILLFTSAHSQAS